MALLLVACGGTPAETGFTPIPGVYGTSPFAGFESAPLRCAAAGAGAEAFPRQPLAQRSLEHAGYRFDVAVEHLIRGEQVMVFVRVSNPANDCKAVVREPLRVDTRYSDQEGGGFAVQSSRSGCQHPVVNLRDGQELLFSKRLDLVDGLFGAHQRLVEVSVGLWEMEGGAGSVRLARVRFHWDARGSLSVDAWDPDVVAWPSSEDAAGASRRYLDGDSRRSDAGCTL